MIISNKVVVDAATMQQCPNLKLILISATGTNNIDLVQARKQGIVVCNCQGYGTAAVAQHTLSLMLALATSLLKYDRAVKQGEWNKASQFCLLDFPIIELSGKMLGIVGYGGLVAKPCRHRKNFFLRGRADLPLCRLAAQNNADRTGRDPDLLRDLLDRNHALPTFF